MDINDVINGNANLNALSQSEYLKIIGELISKCKWLQSQSVNEAYAKSQIEALNADLILNNKEVEKLREINANINKVFSRKMSLKERFTGKIDLKYRTQK